jgi:hypothetical protein
VNDLLQGLLLDQLGHVERLERFAVGAIHQPLNSSHPPTPVPLPRQTSKSR